LLLERRTDSNPNNPWHVFRFLLSWIQTASWP